MTLRHRVEAIRLPQRLAGQLGSDAAVVAGGQVVGLAAGLLTGIVTARELGPSGRGVLAIVLLVPNLLSLFLGFGSAVSNVYLIGAGKIDRRTLSRISVALCVAGSLGGGAIVLGLWLGGPLPTWLPHVRGEDLGLAMLVLPLALLYSAFRAILRGLQEIRMTAVVDAAQSLVMAASTTIALLWLDTGVRGAVVANVIGSLLALAVLAVCLRGRGLSLVPALPRATTGEVVRFGLRGDLANLTQFFTYRFDSFLVNALRTSAAVGIYAVGTRLAELVWVVPTAAATVIVPRAATASAEHLNAQTPRVFAKVLVLTAVTGGLLALVGGVAVNFLYSHAYYSAYRPMLLLLPGAILLGAAAILTGDTTGRGHPGYNSINSVVGLVATVGLDVLLVPDHGIEGAAVASSIAYVLNTLLAVTFFLRVSGMPFREFLSRATRWSGHAVSTAVPDGGTAA